MREVFQLFADGVGYVRMTKILRERKILNPMAYFNQNNPDYFKSDYWRKPFDWHATSVRSILMNQAYIGNVVFGKTKVKGLFELDGYVIVFTSNLQNEAEYKKIIPPELQTRFDLVCEFEEPTYGEKTK